MNINSVNINNRKYLINLSDLFLILVVVAAFTYHYLIYALSNSAFPILLFLFSILSITTRRVRINKSMYFFTWIMAVFVVLLNYSFKYKHSSVLEDLLVLLVGFLLVMFCSRNSSTYDKVLTCIKLFSILFCIGILMQKFAPTFFDAFTVLFPQGMRSLLSSDIGVGQYGLKGFTTNAGFAAGYIITGVFSILSENTNGRKNDKKSIIMIGVLLLSLFLTAKRGPLLFMVLSLTIVYIIPYRGSGKLKRIWILLVAIIGFILLFYILEPLLYNIPIFKRIIETIMKFQEGDDISSGRSGLYAWAVELFLQNPVFGIGWGKYRTTVAGVVTRVREISVHNVFLQLLCETGVLGFSVFCCLFISSWVMVKNLYVKCVQTKDCYNSEWRKPLFFSFVYQTYFLLYCITGNPLYDAFFIIIYAISCAIPVAYMTSATRLT